MRRERVGDGLHRRAQRPLAGGERVAGEPGGERPAVRGADVLGHRLGLVVRQPGERPAEQREHEVVAVHRELGVV